MSENLRTTAGQSASKAFPKEVKSVAALAKEVEQAYSAQRSRLESSFLLRARHAHRALAAAFY
jgi:hypothetical protein